MVDDDGDDGQLVVSSRGQQFMQEFSHLRPSINDMYMEPQSVLGGRSYGDAFGYTSGAYPDDPFQFGGGATTNHYGPEMPLALMNGGVGDDVGSLGQFGPLPDEDDEL